MSEWLLRLKFVQDKQFRYRLVSRTTQRPKTQGPPPADSPVKSTEMILEQRVLRVEADGTGHVISVSTPQVPGGESMRALVYQHLGIRGETLQASTPHQGSAFCFPETPVSVGSTWSGNTQNSIPNSPEPLTMTYHYKVEKLETVLAGGTQRPCVSVSFASDEVQFPLPLPNGSGTNQVTTRTDGTMYIDCEEGCLVKLQLTSTTMPRIGDMLFEVINQSEQILL